MGLGDYGYALRRLLYPSLIIGRRLRATSLITTAANSSRLQRRLSAAKSPPSRARQPLEFQGPQPVSASISLRPDMSSRTSSRRTSTSTPTSIPSTPPARCYVEGQSHPFLLRLPLRTLPLRKKCGHHRNAAARLGASDRQPHVLQRAWSITRSPERCSPTNWPTSVGNLIPINHHHPGYNQWLSKVSPPIATPLFHRVQGRPTGLRPAHPNTSSFTSSFPCSPSPPPSAIRSAPASRSTARSSTKRRAGPAHAPPRHG